MLSRYFGKDNESLLAKINSLLAAFRMLNGKLPTKLYVGREERQDLKDMRYEAVPVRPTPPDYKFQGNEEDCILDLLGLEIEEVNKENYLWVS